MVDTSLVGMVLNGLSHFHQVKDRAHFALCLIRGLGGNLSEKTRQGFATEVDHRFVYYIIEDDDNVECD